MRLRAKDGRRWRLVVVAVAIASLALPASAGAADRLFGTAIGNNVLFAIDLDGSGSGTALDTTPTPVDVPFGPALDPATNSLYWVSATNATVSRVNLDGTGNNTTLYLGTPGPDQPTAVAVDPAGGHLYWSDFQQSTIMRANLDGTNAVILLAGPTVNVPTAIAIDPVGDRLYWTNSGNNTIVRADLSGTNATVLNGSASNPGGIAVDTAGGSLYWTNSGNNTIVRADLDGTNASVVPIGGGLVDDPWGMAVDPDTHRIYWASNATDQIFGANTDGSGAVVLSTTGVTVDGPAAVAILKGPSSAAVPAVTGGAAVGDVLTCAPNWAPDLPEAQLYQRPRTVALQWSLDGTDLGGQTNPTITTASAGAYRCQATGTNLAGTAMAVSGPHAVSAPAASWGAPIVASLSPAAGPATGGTAVTISGTSFGSISRVLFGDAPAAFTVDRFNRITAIAPPHAPGVVRVTVESVDGTSPPTAGGAFEYVAVAAPSGAGTPTPGSPPAPPAGATRRCVVPGVVGKTGAAAKRSIRAAGCRVGHVTRRGRSPRKATAQSPRAGSSQPAGTRVSISLRGRAR